MADLLHDAFAQRRPHRVAGNDGRHQVRALARVTGHDTLAALDDASARTVPRAPDGRPAAAGAGAHAGRHRRAVLVAHPSLRRRRRLLDGVLPRPRRLDAREVDRRLDRPEHDRAAGRRAADRQRRAVAGAHGEGAPAAAGRGHRPEPGLPRADRLPEVRRRRPAPGARAHRRHPRRAARRGDDPVHREDPPRFRLDGGVRRAAADLRPALDRRAHRARADGGADVPAARALRPDSPGGRRRCPAPSSPTATSTPRRRRGRCSSGPAAAA